MNLGAQLCSESRGEISAMLPLPWQPAHQPKTQSAYCARFIIKHYEFIHYGRPLSFKEVVPPLRNYKNGSSRGQLLEHEPVEHQENTGSNLVNILFFSLLQICMSTTKIDLYSDDQMV